MLALQTIFDSYAAASYGVASGRDGIDGTRFLKFCKDVQIFDSSVYRKEDVDIVFAKFKEPSCNSLSFKGFRGAISHIAKKLHVSADVLVKYIVSVSPQASPNSSPSVTIPLPNRLHDDINLYTGIHRLKAASERDMRLSRKVKIVSNSATELSSPLREQYGTRSPSPYMGLYRVSPLSHSISPNRSRQLNQYRQTITHTQSLDEYKPRHTFVASSAPNGSYLKNSLNSYTLQDNQMPTGNLIASNLRSQSPPINDSSLSARSRYTHDMPTSTSPTSFELFNSQQSKSIIWSESNVLPLSSPLKQSPMPPPPPPPLPQLQHEFQLPQQPPPSPTQAPPIPIDTDLQLNEHLSQSNDIDKNELQYIYEAYIFGAQLGVDGARFLKFCKDFQLFDHSFRNMDVDVVFAKYKEAGQRYLSFRGFQSAVHHIAKRRRLPSELLLHYILRNGHCARKLPDGSVLAIPTRFHDDPSSYTGVHRAGGPTVIDDDIKDLSRMVDRSIVHVNSVPQQRQPSPSPSRRAIANALALEHSP